jgi:hypothetical protein
MTFKMNRKAILQIMKSDSIYLDLFNRAEAIRETIDPDGARGYVAVASIAKARARAAVIAASPYSKRSNAKHNTLVRALGSAHD